MEDVTVAQITDAGSLASWLRKIIPDEEALSEVARSEDRIVRAFKELLSGYGQDPRSILNETVRVEEYPGVVTETGIRFVSFCPHHFLPFFGTVDIAYEPRHVITGLGKLPRLVQAWASRLQIQELLNEHIARSIVDSIDAKGVLVRSRATHLCVSARGPAAPGAETTCVYGLGTLREVAKSGFPLSTSSGSANGTG